MSNLGIIFKRELYSYFATPLAYVFIVIFLITNGYSPLTWVGSS